MLAALVISVGLELMIPTDVVMSMVLGTTVYYIGIFQPLMRPG